MKDQTTTVSEIRLAMRRNRLAAGDDGNGRVAEYESLLDLFTLISFILIFAAFIYIARSNDVNQDGSDVVVPQTAQNGTGPTKTLPKDVLLLIIYKESNVDKLVILDGVTNVRRIEVVTRENIEGKLNEISSAITQTKKIHFAIDSANQEANVFIAFDIENWLYKHHYNYRRYFTGAE